MNYVDGFVCAVANANKDAYIDYAKKYGAVFREHGALSVVDCWGDDVPEGKLTSFTMAVKREADESVIFSWITWSSKAARDDAWKKLMEDPRMSPQNNVMPFDGKRLIYGGFQIISEV
jgi:uncharacterized protein YbaA (DUF1428 family)